MTATRPGSHGDGRRVRERSRVWIVWAAAGVVVAGLVVLAIVLVPTLLAGIPGPASTADSAAADARVADEQAAVATIELYDDAWNDVDCDKYVEATTESFRSELQLPDCPAFEQQAQFFTDSTDGYAIEVGSIAHDADAIVVSTTETYTALVGDDGQPLAAPEAIEEQWEYHLVSAGPGWAIDDAGAN